MAIITGIGQAFAVGCAAQGANVVVADMNAADETVSAVEQAGAKALAVKVAALEQYNIDHP